MKTIKLAAALFAITLGALAPSAAKEPAAKAGGPQWDSRAYNISGSVFIKPAGAKNWIPAKGKVPLKTGDTVRTGKKSSADISLDNRGVITLNASTIFLIKKLQRNNALFFLEAGRFVAKVTGLKKRKERLEARTQTAVAAVRGTEFSIAYDSTLEETHVNVFEEGEVMVTSLDENGNPVGAGIVVIPHHEVMVKKEMDAMTLAQSPASRYRSAEIIGLRKKLGALEKTYKPLDERQREEERKETFGGRSGGKNADGTEETSRKSERGQDGAYDRSAQGKRGQNEKDAQGADNRDGGAKGAAGGYSNYSKYGAKSTEAGEAKNSDSDGTGHGKGKYGGTGGLGHGLGGKGRPGAGGSGLGGPGGPGGGPGSNLGDRLKGGGAGNSGSGPGGKPKSGAAGSGLGGKSGAAGSGSGDRLKSGSAGDSGSGSRIKPAAAGGTGGDLFKPGAGNDFSRPASPQDKSVDKIVTKLQDRLAASGNEGAISSPELRTLVQSAAKTSTSDAEFQTTLRVSLITRLAETSAGDTGTSFTTVPTKTAVPTTTFTKPTITSPVITKPTIINTDTKIKRTP